MLSMKIDELLEDKDALFNEDLIQRGFHDGIEVEKGIVLNEDYLEAHYDELCELFSIFTAYPDIFWTQLRPVTQILICFSIKELCYVPSCVTEIFS